MHSTDRRTFLKLSAAGASMLSLTGCDGFYRNVARFLGSDIPDHVAIPDAAEVDPAHHVLARVGFGPWPGDLERVRAMGVNSYLEEQLAPDTIDDGACELLARRFESIHMTVGDLYEYHRGTQAHEDLTRMTLLRAIYSRRQLYEAVVHFWTDHFNIDMGKSECAWLKVADDRDVIRKHALGNFRDLVYASATSPAMLVYLDGRANKKDSATDKPNENYGRELMELHTLGVHGGYTQKDVMEAARCLSGWSFRRRTGLFQHDPSVFHAGDHDNDEKTVLGVTIPAGGGAKDLDQLIDIVAHHPSTANFLATKLARRFVADDPPAGLVARTAEAFTKSNGDIKTVLRTIFFSDEFRRAAGAKLKRPFGFVVSAVRALGADTNAGPGLIEYLERLGQVPFQFPTPDGYPDEAAPWLGTLLWRWNFAVALATNAIHGTHVDLKKLAHAIGTEDAADPVPRFMSYLFGRTPTDAEVSTIRKFLNGQGDSKAEALGLVLASPAFQRC